MILSAAGCSSAPLSSGQSNLSVCGKELSRAAAAPVLVDAVNRSVSIDSTSVDGNIYLRLSRDCNRGVALTQSDAFKLVDSVLTSDDKVSAAIIHPVVRAFKIKVANSSTSWTISVALSS